MSAWKEKFSDIILVELVLLTPTNIRKPMIASHHSKVYQFNSTSYSDTKLQSFTG